MNDGETVRALLRTAAALVRVALDEDLARQVRNAA
jgi:hypothetical protein